MAGRTRMPQKGPGKGREDERRTSEGLPQGDLGKTYSTLLNGWSTFYRDMGTRLTDGFTKQQRAYEELFRKWNAFTGSVGKVVEEAATDESQREMYDVWRNYMNKVGSRMTKAATEGMKGYGETAASLDRQAERIADLSREVVAGKIPAVKAEDVYGTWLEVSGKLRQQMDRSAGLSREELDDLSRTWTEFSGKMESLVADQVAKGGPYGQLVDLWAIQSKDVGEALSGFIRGHDHDYEENRKAWTEHFLHMQTNMQDLARAIGDSFEDMYRRFLEGGSTSLSDLPMFPRWWSTKEGESVENLKRRIEELERKAKKAA